MCVCVQECTRAHVRTSTCLCVRVCAHVHICVCAHAHMRAHVGVCTRRGERTSAQQDRARTLADDLECTLAACAVFSACCDCTCCDESGWTPTVQKQYVILRIYLVINSLSEHTNCLVWLNFSITLTSTSLQRNLKHFNSGHEARQIDYNS